MKLPTEAPAGLELRRLRAALGLSQAEAAKLAMYGQRSAWQAAERRDEPLAQWRWDLFLARHRGWCYSPELRSLGIHEVTKARLAHAELVYGKPINVLLKQWAAAGYSTPAISELVGYEGKSFKLAGLQAALAFFDVKPPYRRADSDPAHGHVRGLQSHNARRLEHDGIVDTLTGWAARLGIAPGSLHTRLKRHPLEVALSVRRLPTKIEHARKCRKAREAAKALHFGERYGTQHLAG